MPPRKKNPTNLAQIPTNRTPFFRGIYSNALKLSISPTEVRLTFACTTDNVGANTGFINEEEVCIYIHPANAKIMLGQIRKVLQNYEKLWGKIEIPSAMVTPEVKALFGEEK